MNYLFPSCHKAEKNGEANGAEKAANGGHGDAGDDVIEDDDDDLICTDDEPAPPVSPRYKLFYSDFQF